MLISCLGPDLAAVRTPWKTKPAVLKFLAIEARPALLCLACFGQPATFSFVSSTIKTRVREANATTDQFEVSF
jgi:hypothetical protein